MTHYDVAVIGTGMGSLTTAALLARDGYKVGIFEFNHVPGGCTSSFWRKGYVFESGATTLVGLDDHMPLRWLFDEIGISINAKKLEIPMRVLLPNGQTITRFNDVEQWIEEAERVFGKKNQREFWEYCYNVSRFVWETSLTQRYFPPSSVGDVLKTISSARPKHIKFARLALVSMAELLQEFDLLDNEMFVQFINEQLIITAQNYISDVNVLFGATAVCYTNFGNYYVFGGLINLVNPICDYVSGKNDSEIHYKTLVEKVRHVSCGLGNKYYIKTSKGDFTSDLLISGIPINNTLEMFSDNCLRKKFDHKLLCSEKLHGAFTMGIAFKKRQKFDCLHYQIHLDKPLIHAGSRSIFLSLSHPDDSSRAPDDQYVGAISTHISNPELNFEVSKAEIENEIFEALKNSGLVEPEDITYYHSSNPRTWEKWTKRKFGFVGGYPQFMSIKPWQMIDARLDGRGAYICGDTVYPGQGIPGTTLSGIIAYHKLKSDHSKILHKF